MRAKVSQRQPLPAFRFRPRQKHCIGIYKLNYILSTIKLQIESMHFALQNPAYCEPKPWVLLAKMQGFANHPPFCRMPK